MILWSHNAFPRRPMQCEFVVVNGQTTTTTSEFHNSIKVRWTKLRSFTSSFFVMLYAKN